MTTISTAYSLPSHNTGRLVAVDSQTAATTIYTLGVITSDSLTLGMFYSTDGGGTWTGPVTKSSESGDAVIAVSMLLRGTTIHVVYNSQDGTNFNVSYAEFNCTTKLWQTPNLPESVHSGTGGQETTAAAGCDIVYAGSEIILASRQGTSGDGKMWHEPLADTSWASPIDISGNYSAVRGLCIGSDSTMVHVHAGNFVKTLDTSDWTFSTEIVLSDVFTYDEKECLFPPGFAYLGTDSGTDIIGLAGNQDIGLGGDGFVERWPEDANNELTATGATLNIAGTGDGATDHGSMVIADYAEPGDVRMYWRSFSATSLYRALSSTYADTFHTADTASTDVGSDTFSGDLWTYSVGLGEDRVVGIVYGTLTLVYWEDVVAIGASVESAIRPIGDTSGVGWETAPTAGGDLFAQVDELTADDTDYIYAKDPNP